MDFGPFGLSEILLIGLLLLVLFGPRRLPEMGRCAAEIVTKLRRGSQELRRALEAEVDAGTGGAAREVTSAARELGQAGREFEVAAKSLLRRDTRATPQRETEVSPRGPEPGGAPSPSPSPSPGPRPASADDGNADGQ